MYICIYIFIYISPKNHYDCKFNKLWIKNPDFKDWLRPYPESEYYAFCKTCKTDLHLKRIRISTVHKHHKGEKHREIMSITLDKPKSSLLNFFFKPA